LNLSEKNNLYLSQKKEIESLKKLVSELENKLNIRNEYDKNSEVHLFLKKFFFQNLNKIEAKELYLEYKMKNKKSFLGKRNFYKVAAIYGYHSKRGNENKLFVHGKE